jgi:hypothetical protein
MTRGDYGRWMQDARDWSIQALRAERHGDPYREQGKVDEELRTAGLAVRDAVAQDSAHAAARALHDYLRLVRDRSGSRSS